MPRSVTRTTRRTLISAAATTSLTGMLGGCIGQSWDDLPTTRLTVATGNRGGVFDLYGNALAAVLDERLGGVSVKTRNTNASLVNLREVANGTSDIGLTLGDVAADAVRGTGTFRTKIDIAALTRTYDSFVHLIVRADSTIRGVADLRGRRVAVGAQGSGTRVIATRILAAAGIGLSELDATAYRLEDAAAGLRGDTLDAFFFVSGLPNTTVLDLAGRLAIRLVDLGSLVDTLAGTYRNEYTPGPIPASSYDLPGPVDTVSVKNYVVVNADLDDDVAYAATRVMFEAQAAVDRIAPGIRQPNLGAAIFTSPLPLHPGALRYFRERHL